MTMFIVLAILACFAFFAATLGGLLFLLLFLFGLVAVAIVSLRTPATKVSASDIVAIGHKFVVLPDGRKLEYSVRGDLQGVPVYYQHGYLCGCCISSMWDSMAKEYGIMLIAASMPGFGYSDSYPLGVQRSLLDWPADVLAVLKQERISKIHLLGMSAGCVHAAALAHGLPESMVGNVCLGTPTCPDEVPGANAEMAFSTLIMKKLMGKPYIGDFIAYLMARQMTPHQLLTAVPDCKAALLRAEKEHLPEVSQFLVGGMEHGLRFTYRGIVDNACTMEAPIPFDLRELQKLTSKGHAVGITSSDDDTTNPPLMQHWFHGQIPGSVLMKFPLGWGHLHCAPRSHFTRILRFLLSGEDVEVSVESKIAGFGLRAS